MYRQVWILKGIAGILMLSACSTAAQTSDEVSGSPGVDDASSVHSEADVRFIREMIHHHEQAVHMAALVPDRTESRDLRLLARRIDVSQQDEIAWMRDWLRRRGEDPDADSSHSSHTLMPGMLTAREMEQLSDAGGEEFERLFLQFMIQHHEGALVMVSTLLATPGAAQESEIFRFASDVDADQRAEILRMRDVLTEWSN